MGKKIFISHASKDEPIVTAFLEHILCLGLSIKRDDVFYTSGDGTRPKSGEDWRNDIKQHLIDSRITFLIITPNYKESEMCQNEMGASWVLSGTILPYFVEPISYDTVGILQEPKQAEKLTSDGGLDRLRDTVKDILALPDSDIKSDNWTTQKEVFLSKVATHLKEEPFPPALSRDVLEKEIAQKEKLKISFDSLVTANTTLKHKNEDLKKAKDKKEVDNIEKKYAPKDELEQFKNSVSRQLKLLKTYNQQ